LRLLTYQEALSRSSELVNELKGKWFYLSGEGLNENGLYTFTEKGELAKLVGNETLDKKVRVWKGNNPPSLGVISDDYARGGAKYVGGRFLFQAISTPFDVAPVVVGVRAKVHKKWKTPSGNPA
jgi:hypothetical protein